MSLKSAWVTQDCLKEGGRARGVSSLERRDALATCVGRPSALHSWLWAGWQDVCWCLQVDLWHISWAVSLPVCCYVLDIKPSPLSRFACFPYAARVSRYQVYRTDLSRINWPWTVEVKTLGPRACMPGLDEPVCWLRPHSCLSSFHWRTHCG